MKFTHFNTQKSIKKFLLANPQWVSGFVDGEGCFTASFQVDIRSTWGVQPQAEFNVVQNNVDKLLLEGIKEHFDNKGGVYSRPNNLSVYSVRNSKDLRETIVPYFLKYPLISNKSNELEKFSIYLDLLSINKHVGKTLSSRDQFLVLACLIKELNSKRLISSKIDRMEIIIDWLKSLDDLPTIDDKLLLKERTKRKSSQDDLVNSYEE
jgi:hypothetical protein